MSNNCMQQCLIINIPYENCMHESSAFPKSGTKVDLQTRAQKILFACRQHTHVYMYVQKNDIHV